MRSSLLSGLGGCHNPSLPPRFTAPSQAHPAPPKEGPRSGPVALETDSRCRGPLSEARRWREQAVPGRRRPARRPLPAPCRSLSELLPLAQRCPGLCPLAAAPGVDEEHRLWGGRGTLLPEAFLHAQPAGHSPSPAHPGRRSARGVTSGVTSSRTRRGPWMWLRGSVASVPPLVPPAGRMRPPRGLRPQSPTPHGTGDRHGPRDGEITPSGGPGLTTPVLKRADRWVRLSTGGGPRPPGWL